MLKFGTLRALLERPASAVRNQSVFDLVCQAYNEEEELYKEQGMAYLASAFERDLSLWIPARTIRALELAHEVVPVGYFRLDLSDGRIHQVGCERLAKMPLLAKVRQLDLSYSELKARDLKLLAASPHLGQISLLELSGNGLSPQMCQEMLATSSLAPEAVISLTYDSHPAYEALLTHALDTFAASDPRRYVEYCPEELAALLALSDHEAESLLAPPEVFDLARVIHTFNPSFAQLTLRHMGQPREPAARRRAEEAWAAVGFTQERLEALLLKPIHDTAHFLADAYTNLSLEARHCDKSFWGMDWASRLPWRVESRLRQISLPQLPSFGEMLQDQRGAYCGAMDDWADPNGTLAQVRDLAHRWRAIGVAPDLAWRVASGSVLKLSIYLGIKVNAQADELWNTRLLEIDGVKDGERLPAWIERLERLEVVLLRDFTGQRLPPFVMKLPQLKAIGLRGPAFGLQEPESPITENIRSQVEYLLRTKPHLQVI